MSKKSQVSVETTIVSYLTAFPSRDLIRAAHQQITRGWWTTRDDFELFASQLVVREAAAGDPGAAVLRLEALRGINLLRVTPEATALAENLLRRGGFPRKATADAFHGATAVAGGMDDLLTWNCKHIANATMRVRIDQICREAGFQPPIICIPEELVHA